MRELLQRMQCVRGMVGFQCRRLGARLSADSREDLVQSTLLAVWRKLDTYAGTGRLESWIFRFTYLETLERLRAERRAPRLLQDVEDAPVPVGDVAPPSSGEAERYASLYRVLDRLSAEARTIVLMRHVEERTFEDIGERLSMPKNTAKTKYYRALMKLRGLLSSRADDLDPGAPA